MKENKIEKLILDLSNRWECTPQEAVDRLNSMDESEINKLINSMTKKFQMGGKPLYGVRTIKEFVPKTQPVDTTKSEIMRLWETDPEKALELRDADLRKKLAQERSEKLQKNAIKWSNFLNNVGLPKTQQNTQIQIPTSLYKNGGMIDCLRNGGSVEKCKCGCDKISKAEDGKKVRRTDMPGYAYTLSDGTDVLTQDAVGIQPLPGSNYSISGSTPEYETQRTTLTDKSGNVVGYNYNVFVNDGDHFGPIKRYTTKRMWEKPSTWFRTVLQENPAKTMKEAYDANKLKCGGSLPKKKKNYLKKK